MSRYKRERGLDMGLGDKTYTLKQAVKVARYFEKKFKPIAHICLGGSCLHAGYSEKDIDLYIYADSGEEAGLDPTAIIGRLHAIPKCEIVSLHLFWDGNAYARKPFIKLNFRGFPIDLFFIYWEPLEVGSRRLVNKETGDTLDEDVPF